MLVHHHDQKQLPCAQAKGLAFEGVGVVCMQVHNVTKQVEYRGELVEVTESLSHLPSGGQVLLSHTTYRGICQHAQDIKLPSPTARVSKPVLDWHLPGQLVRHVRC